MQLRELPSVVAKRSPSEPRDRARPTRAGTLQSRPVPAARLTIESLQVFSCAAASAFAAALLAGQFLREALLHIAGAASGPLMLGFLAAGAALGLWLPRSIARLGAGSPARPGSDLAGVVFAAVALVAGGIAVPAGWTAARLERWREMIATSFLLPTSLALPAVVGPLALAGVLVGATAAVALAALHGWHRTSQRQRLHIAPLWIAWSGAAAAGCVVAFALREPNRYWYAPALVLFAAAGIAVFRRNSDSPDVPHNAAIPAAQPSVEPIGTAAAVGAILAVTLATDSAGGLLETPAAMAIGGVIGVVLLRLCVRLTIGPEFAPLAAILAAFLLLQSGLGSFVPITASALATAGLALLGRQAAREARSIQHSLATVGATSAAAFAIAAMVLGSVAGTLQARTAILIVSVPVCAGLAFLLVFDRRRSRAARAAALACLAVWVVTAIAGARQESGNTQASQPDDTRVRAALVSEADTLVLGRAAEAIEVDLAAPPVATIVIAASAPDSAGLERRLVDRVMRRLGRRLLPGGRLVLERPLDPGVATVVDRYVRKSSPAFGPASELSVFRTGDESLCAYRAVVIGSDIGEWIGGRAWPADYDASLCPLTPANVQGDPSGSGR